MTKKDYILIANALISEKPHQEWLNKWVQYKLTVYAIAHALQNDNPRFDIDKFERACGVID